MLLFSAYFLKMILSCSKACPEIRIGLTLPHLISRFLHLQKRIQAIEQSFQTELRLSLKHETAFRILWAKNEDIGVVSF